MVCATKGEYQGNFSKNTLSELSKNSTMNNLVFANCPLIQGRTDKKKEKKNDKF